MSVRFAKSEAKPEGGFVAQAANVWPSFGIITRKEGYQSLTKEAGR